MTSTTETTIFTGGCTCGNIRYQLTNTPLFIHCCHCSWCQRETGSAFIINAMIERSCFSLIPSKLDAENIREPLRVKTPSASGKGQVVYRCPSCFVAVWSEYSSGPIVKFVRQGTLDEAMRFPPDIHIFTSTKQPWVKLEGSVPVCEEYYDR
jgi:hypothetical protein